MRRLYGKQSVDTPQSLLGASQTHKKGRLISENAPVTKPAVTRVKTDGRIGSATPPSYLKGGLSVKNNPQHSLNAPLGAKAAKHMSPSHQGGDQWSPRVAKARAQANRHKKATGFRNPINVDRPALKPVKPS